MTIPVNFDQQSKKADSLFSDQELDRFGVRMRPADFARLIGCSKQAVSLWIRDGKVTLGADGRLDPSLAVNQLLRNSNPEKLRSRLLAPLFKEIRSLKSQLAQIHLQRLDEKEDHEFTEGVNEELQGMIKVISDRLVNEWDMIRAIPGEIMRPGIRRWIAHLEQYAGIDYDRSVIEFLEIDADTDQALDSKEGDEGLLVDDQEPDSNHATL